MNTKNISVAENLNFINKNLIEHLLNEGWTYIKTVVNVNGDIRPILMLDANLNIIAANDAYYQFFQSVPGEIEHQHISKIGGGVWNILSLQKELSRILPEGKSIKGIEVSKTFPDIGDKTLMINAHQIHFKTDPGHSIPPSTIMLTIDDVTDMINVAETIVRQVSSVEKKMLTQIGKLESHVKKLEKEIVRLKK